MRTEGSKMVNLAFCVSTSRACSLPNYKIVFAEVTSFVPVCECKGNYALILIMCEFYVL